MADSSQVPRNVSYQQPKSTLRKEKRGGKSDDLDARQTPKRTPTRTPPKQSPSKPIPAWQLRERMKNQPNTVPFSGSSTHSNRSLASKSADAELDPTLPPAFRTAFMRQKKEDDFMSQNSVHSSKTQASMTTARSTYNDSDSFDDDSSTFDGHDSFASLGEDDEDDEEAYREQRNLMARQELESSRPRKNGVLKSQDFRLRKHGFEGTTLDFIAE